MGEMEQNVKSNKMKIIYIKLVICFCIMFLSCTQETKKKQDVKKNIVKVPIFNEDSAYFFVEKQVSFGPRVISSKAWLNCANWLEKKLSNYGETKIQEAPIVTYDKKEHILKNIIVSFSPEKNNRIALFAHWDSRHVADHDTINQFQPILGANDGGSGVGVLIEIARQLNIKKPKIGVDIVLFDAEDYGQPENSKFPIMEDSWCLGSQYWSKQVQQSNYYAKYGILLDMVGGKNAKFTHEATSYYFAKDILKKVWSKAHSLGYGDFFVYQNTKQIIDDHYYVNTIAGIRTIDIIEYDPSTKTNFNKHWHTHGDNMNNIDKKTLKAVGQTLLEIIYNE